MAGHIGDDETAAGRLEGTVGDIDRDALLALVLQAVDQESQIGCVALGAVAAGVRLDPLQLVGESLSAVVQDPADEGALAVVDAPAQDESKR